MPAKASSTTAPAPTRDGWDEETFYARYRLGFLLGENVSGIEGMRELLAAWEMRPGRAEPLRAIANLANSIADKIPYPADRLFVHPSAYKRPAPAAKTVADISAIIVTRGDVDLRDILDALPYQDVVIWDNSQRSRRPEMLRPLPRDERSQERPRLPDRRRRDLPRPRRAPRRPRARPDHRQHAEPVVRSRRLRQGAERPSRRRLPHGTRPPLGRVRRLPRRLAYG